jgi:hypothetical protein
MTSRRAIAFLWLCLVGFTLAAPLFAAEGCEEACDVHCGDCVWCPLNAEVVPMDTTVAMIDADVPSLSSRGAGPVPGRAPDHIPLSS